MTTKKGTTINGDTALGLRKKDGVNQGDFWRSLGVTQSGGSRYESGRNMPAPVRKLYYLMKVVGVESMLTDSQRKTLASIK